VPTSTFTRTDEIKATLYTQRGVTKAGAADLLVNIEGKQRPMFAYSYQTIDDQKGANKDGLVQRGEQVRTLVTVKNIGQGKAPHTEAVLRNGTSQEGILISAGRFEAKDLGPGESKTFSFVYEVRPDYKGDAYQPRDPVGVRGHRRPQVGRDGTRHLQARLGGDAAALDRHRADGRGGRHRAHQGARLGRAPGA
jgi:hypothetical protein